MTTLDARTDAMVKSFILRKEDRRERNESIKHWYEAYFVEDKLAEPGVLTIATPDSRNAVDLGIFILSGNDHIDRLPRGTSNDVDAAMKNKAERFLAGNWREMDWKNLDRGMAWHQRLLAGWMLMTGWYAQFTAMIPGSDGEPMAVADLWDPAMVYPEWGGVTGGLIAVEHEFFYPLRSLREMADFNGWNGANLDGDEDDLILLWEHWESRYNKKSPKQPDILHAVMVSEPIKRDQTSMVTTETQRPWHVLQELTNRRTDSKQGGFVEIPVLINAVGGVEVSSAYAEKAGVVLSKQGQGLLAGSEGVQAAMNRQITALLQTVERVRIGEETPVITSGSGSKTMDVDAMGKPQSLSDGDTITYPHNIPTNFASAQMVINFLQDMFQRTHFPWVNQAPISASGVAIKAVGEVAQSHLGSYHYFMRHVYQRTGRMWLRDYKRRWGERFGSVQLQGTVRTGGASGQFDEEFTPDSIPENNYVLTDIPWRLVEDDMMNANIARMLVGPQGQLASFPYVREKYLKAPDELLQRDQIARDTVEGSPVWQNTGIWEALRDAAQLALNEGDRQKAVMYASFAKLLEQSLLPQQGQGIAQQPGQGFSAAGGNFGNAGGGRPALSPDNQPSPVLSPEAAAGPGVEAQAERNV